MQTDSMAENVQVNLPDFCRWQVVMAAIVMGIIVLLSVQLVDEPMQWDADAWFRLGIELVLIIALAMLIVFSLCLLRNWLNNFEGNRAWWVSWLLIIVAGMLVSHLGWLLLQKMVLPLPAISALTFSVRISIIIAMIAAAMLRYFYVQQLWHQETLSQNEARVQALQSRIRPHFLFNSLNSIAALIPENPQKAEQATEDLADLFRSAMRDTSTMSTLADELSMVEKYLRIEQHRLGPRLRVNWQVDDLPVDARMPPLLLQPLVENAVAHGVEPLANGGTVDISGACDGDYVVIVVTSPYSNRTPARSGNQMAVANIRERLYYHYSGRASLILAPTKQSTPGSGSKESGDRFQTILRFPYDAYTSG